MSDAARKMDEHKARLVEHDKDKAIEALTEHIHCVIAPRALRKGREAESVEIFAGGGEISAFCESKHICGYALSWVFDGLARDGLAQGGEGGAFRLTDNGVRRYCVSLPETGQ